MLVGLLILSGCGAVSSISNAPDPVPPRGFASGFGGYSADQFGGWRDDDRNGCDTRDEVLARDATVRTYAERGDRCVSDVTVRDMYTGQPVVGRSNIDLDHVVARADAWRSGASGWTRAQRVAFANDQRNLISTRDGLNQSKSDRGPDAFRPPDRAAWCWYGTTYETTKNRYALTITPAQATAIAELRRTCVIR